MKIRQVTVTIVLLIAMGAAAYLAYRQAVAPARQCQLCRREIRAGHESAVLLKDGTRLRTCCPRCALHRARHGQDQLIGVVVADHTTGQEIAAQNAVYVQGSDETTCVPESESPPREPGVMYETVYDRCLPSLTAFRNYDKAQGFAAVHGGKILSYVQALESVGDR